MRKEPSKFWTRVLVPGGNYPLGRWVAFGNAATQGGGWSDGPPGAESSIVNPVFLDNLQNAPGGQVVLDQLPQKGYIKKIGIQLQSATLGDPSWNSAPVEEVALRILASHPRPSDYLHPDGTTRPAGERIQETIYAGRIKVEPFNCDGTDPNGSSTAQEVPNNLWGIWPFAFGNSPETRHYEYMNAVVQDDLFYHKHEDGEFAVYVAHDGRFDTIVTVHLWVEGVV